MSVYSFSACTGRGLLLALAMGLPACSVTDQAAETSAPTVTPTQVRTDADRRAIYNSNGAPTRGGYAVPDANPNNVHLGEQAAEINREKRIENSNTNAPNNTTTETRYRRLDGTTPVIIDTTRH